MPIHLTKGLGEFLKSQGAIALATNGSALAVHLPQKHPMTQSIKLPDATAPL